MPSGGTGSIVTLGSRRPGSDRCPGYDADRKPLTRSTPVTTPDTTEAPAEPWEQPTRTTRARRARLVTARRPFVILILVGSMFGVVLVTLSTLVVAQRGATETIIEAEAGADAELQVAISLTSVDAQAGELHVRLVITPQRSERVVGGLVAEGFRISVNDFRGESTYTFREGEPLRSVNFSVALGGGSTFQYPFDSYNAAIVVLATDGADPDPGAPLSVDPVAAGSLLAFDASGGLADDCPFGLTCLTLDIQRPLSTIGYVLWFIALIWGLALAGLGVLYVVVRRGVELPIWAFGYLVGALFALPPLRGSLPGSPPAGGFVDFVAFYWAVAVIGVTLLVLVSLWIRENRRA